MWQAARRRAERNKAVQKGSATIREIEEIGAELHDLQAGLLDFSYQAESATVMLCWKLGEASVEHWHATSGCTG